MVITFEPVYIDKPPLRKLTINEGRNILFTSQLFKNDKDIDLFFKHLTKNKLLRGQP